MEFLIWLGIIAIIVWLLWRHYKKITTFHLDIRGYERDGYNKLVHRKVAYKCLYSYPKYPLRFGDYDIHHKDKNKRNNNPNNLQILTRKQHKKKHGIT